MKNYFNKFKGGSVALPAPVALNEIAFAWLGGFLAIAAVGFLTKASALPLVLGSFGASCVLLFGFPKSPFSQPRNVIGGHFLSTLTGIFSLPLLFLGRVF